MDYQTSDSKGKDDFADGSSERRKFLRTAAVVTAAAGIGAIVGGGKSLPRE
jgi:TAT (twin-arginine translocation) pathway signal sequence